MEVSVENTSTLGRRLKLSIPGAEINDQFKTKMAKLAREVHIKGFRPGRVPPHILHKKFGSSVRSEVINELIRQYLGNAFEKNQLQPAGMPTIDEIKEQANENLEFVASFEVYPLIVLASLAEVEIEKRVVEITSTDIDKMIVKLKDQLANWENVERNIQAEDRITVDFARLLKEENAQREEQKNVQMLVATEGVLPGLSEALLGKTKGAEIEVELRYPDKWADNKVAGKEVTLWITVHQVEEKKPINDDELIEKLGLSKDESLAEKIRERMQEELDTVLQDELKEAILEKLLERNPIELPNALLAQEKEAMRKEMSRARKVEIPKEIFHSEEIETSARRRVELGLLLNEVISKHNLKADAKRIRAAIEKIAARFAGSPEVIDAYYNNKELLHGVERMVLLDQAVDALLAEIKLKDKKATFDEVMNPQEENG